MANNPLQSYSPLGNSTHADSRVAVQNFANKIDATNQWRVGIDATVPSITLSKVVTATGADTGGKITIDLSTLLAWDGTNKTVALREFTWKDSATCVEMRAMVLMTEEEAV